MKLKTILQNIPVVRGFVGKPSPMSNPSDELLSVIGAGPSTAGVTVTPETMLSLSQVFACVRAIAEDSAKLPCGVYQKQERGRKYLAGHRVDSLMSLEANPEMIAFNARMAVTASAALFGNGYAEIERDGAGRPLWLWPIMQHRVAIRRVGGKLVYEIDGGRATIPAADMLHIPGFTFNGIVGEAIATHGKESSGIALAAQQFAGAFFGNGIMPGIVFTFPNAITEEQKVNLKAAKEEMHKGAGKAFKLMAVDTGGDVKRVSWNAEETQVLESRQFSVEDVCRWFRVSPSKIGHLLRAQGWSTLEQLNTDYANETLTPWLVRWEQEGGRKLFTPSEIRAGLYLKHSLQALLRGDTAARGAFYNIMQQNGTYSVNDVREFEDLNPIEGGDEHFIQLNMQPLKLAANPKPAPVSPSARDMQAVFDRLMADAKARLGRVEADKLARKGKNRAEIEAFFASHAAYVRAATAPIAEATGITTFDPEVYCREQCAAAIAAIAEKE